ncbi:MAG: molybdenum cofactor guanylyltransferase MobA [Campylobacterales bacterium]|nr:molybdenum cofactor guanylyltransferase MobA [Campylobacterales bacterium]
MRQKSVAVVFAGGKSSRMKRDKALLSFGGYETLSEFQYRKLAAWFDEVYLASKEAKFDFTDNLILDCYDVYSPLSAIVSVFETLPVEEVFILSVDTPLIDESIVKTLQKNLTSDLDAVIAQTPEGLHPLCGFYKRSILPLASEHLQKNEHRLQTLLDRAHTGYVTFESDAAFINLNTPEEYTEAVKLISSV